MYKFIKIRHDIIKQCHGNYKEMEKFNYKLDIEMFRNCTPKKLGVLRGSSKEFGCPKKHPDALLAKTMMYHVTKSKLDHQKKINEKIKFHTHAGDWSVSLWILLGLQYFISYDENKEIGQGLLFNVQVL